jgi:hypothetical protein
MTRVRTRRRAQLPRPRGRARLKPEMQILQCGREDRGISLGLRGFLIARPKRLVPNQPPNDLNQAPQGDPLWMILS